MSPEPTSKGKIVHCVWIMKQLLCMQIQSRLKWMPPQKAFSVQDKNKHFVS